MSLEYSCHLKTSAATNFMMIPFHRDSPCGLILCFMNSYLGETLKNKAPGPTSLLGFFNAMINHDISPNVTMLK